jgi:hypothetical protein
MSEKEPLDLGTKRLCMMEMEEQQDKMVEERDENIALLAEDSRGKNVLPKTLSSKLERI